MLQPFVERRRGNRLQHADHRQGDAVVLDEAELVFEDALIVAVESDDKAGVDIEARRLNPSPAWPPANRPARSETSWSLSASPSAESRCR